eukprot:CAMPEP_0114609592 /NCGR_PEP_ID=MMETSP0168-20121206/3167_1 /TAXON_ID=95228 ORGANISM="Vannella sp., Strain DIVA3 517/6/12" /NCGR_SAMPLE_ID=MMETSP0168 /ASSEMBLY_ACC=CAM_ASM_000044 /LENGTH=49 /DNA_ID=CAMNT_0001820513 /DNA_START=185 /DNA_END=334 /DNA_ORIENTATION=-
MVRPFAALCCPSVPVRNLSGATGGRRFATLRLDAFDATFGAGLALIPRA